ncbi:MAG: hypothetical protein ACJAVT_002803 [Yoonia sp.]|jgi:hypothetical protein
MRGFTSILAALVVIGLGYWAYHQNIQTQQSIRQVDRLHVEISRERERLSVLRAEWAYLSRPDRLRELAEINFDRLRLMPMTPAQFGNANQIVYPALPALEEEVILENASSAEAWP